MKDWKLLLAIGVVVACLCSCADLSSSILSEDKSFDQALKAAYSQSSSDLAAIQQAFLNGNTVKTHQAIAKAQKDLQTAFNQLQKYEDKLATTASKAAVKGDKYNDEHGFSLNPFHSISLGLGIVLDGVVHLVLLVVLILIGLSIASVFFPALGPIISIIWSFFHTLVTSAQNVTNIAASGVAKLTGKY